MDRLPDLGDFSEPRTAGNIATTTGLRIEQVLWILRRMRQAGVIRHVTDEAGVMRWETNKGST